ncbi:hypothetical protein [Xanthovirga aplysinae]|uniref:hypothetical protein n=1 Tax=Xanthovirga aplysinae TaxID=2529853 RepID=UPI0012BBA243|nr:hypothetical protein [Xanthovirga aplysinae]MTI29542.1 hypothetical protein [Xanthovirga aplysinae]
MKRQLFFTIFLFLGFTSVLGQNVDKQEIDGIEDLEYLERFINKKDNQLEGFKKNLAIINKLLIIIETHAQLDYFTLEKDVDKIKSFSSSSDKKEVLASFENLTDYLAEGIIEIYRAVSTTEAEVLEIEEAIPDPSALLDQILVMEDLRFLEADKGIEPKGLTSFQQSLSVAQLVSKRDSLITGITKALEKQEDKLSKQVAQLEADIFQASRKRFELHNVLKKEHDKTIFQWGFPVFIAFILTIFLFPLWFYFKKQESGSDAFEQLYKLIYGSGLITEIVTVFLLTSTILLLGITEKLESEILGTLIGGISGYVLGRSLNAKKKEEMD